MNPMRFISGAAAIALTLLSAWNSLFFILFISFLTAGGLYEFFYLIKKKDIPIYSYTGIFIGVLIPLSIFTRFELTKNWELLFFVCAFLLILMLQFNRKDNRNAILGLSTTLFGVLYVSWFFSFIVKIYLLLPGFDGPKLVLFIVAVTKCGDIGALLIGSWLGKHPLLPQVSPNKSVEGTVGGAYLQLCGGCPVLFFVAIHVIFYARICGPDGVFLWRAWPVGRPFRVSYQA
jgi:phosphatidate cytidylyltransferase